MGAFRSGHPPERMVAVSGNRPRNLSQLAKGRKDVIQDNDQPNDGNCVFSPLSAAQNACQCRTGKEMPGRRAFSLLPNYPRGCAQLSV